MQVVTGKKATNYGNTAATMGGERGDKSDEEGRFDGGGRGEGGIVRDDEGMTATHPAQVLATSDSAVPLDPEAAS